MKVRLCLFVKVMCTIIILAQGEHLEYFIYSQLLVLKVRQIFMIVLVLFTPK